MRHRRVEIIVKVYLGYSTLVYFLITVRFFFVVETTASIALLVACLTGLINVFNVLEVFAKEPLQYRLFLLSHVLLSILFYAFMHPLLGLEYYIVTIHIFSALLFERPTAAYAEVFFAIILVGLAKLFSVGGTSSEILQEYFMYLTLCGLSTFGLAVLMKYRTSIFLLQQDRVRLEVVLSKMESINRQYRDYLVNVEVNAMERERKRITREIHDIVGHAMITNISMLERISSMIGNREPGREIKMIVDAAHENATEGLEHARLLLYEFRTQPPIKTSGLTAIGQMVSIFRTATGIPVRLEFGNCPNSFGRDVDGVVYHLIEESLINSFRHGMACSILVHIQTVNQILHVDVHDDGIGASSCQEGLGLTGMRERIESLAGELKVGSTITGFRVSAKLPVFYAQRDPIVS